MIRSIQESTAAIANYGKEMASVSTRIAKAFREDSDVSVETEFAKSTLIENGLRANTKVVQVEDEMLASVLSIIA